MMTNDFTCDVLIVEDERIQCEEMASFLARAGLSVAMANDRADGGACFEVLRRRLARPSRSRRRRLSSTTHPARHLDDGEVAQGSEGPRPQCLRAPLCP